MAGVDSVGAAIRVVKFRTVDHCPVPPGPVAFTRHQYVAPGVKLLALYDVVVRPD